MTISEKLLTQIGEKFYTELKEIKILVYCTKEEGTENSFTIQTDDGQEFVVEVKQKK